MSKKNLILLFVMLVTASVSFAQEKFFTKTGKINFFSKATLEDIEAKNKTVTAVIDSKSGAIQFSVQMKGFEFEKKLMQQHFNENYVESDKFPKAVFTGKIQNAQDLKLTQDGTYALKVNGSLTIHGVTKEQNAQAVFTVKGGNIEANRSSGPATARRFIVRNS